MKRLLYTSLWIVLGLVSCQKYLDVKPAKNLAVPKTISDLQALLDHNDFLNRNMPVLAQVGTDEYYLENDSWLALDEKSRNAYVWDTAIYNGVIPNDWLYTYRPVYYANLVLEKAKELDVTPSNEDAWKNIVGSAHFFRANSFLRGAFIWSNAYDKQTSNTDLGIPLRMSSDFNQPSKRASVAETYHTIIKDLLDAARYLPVHSLHPMRPSKLAAWGLLSRTYLSMREYESAYKYADSVLEVYGVLMDYNNVNPALAYPFNRFNQEVIFHNRDALAYSSVLYSFARVDSTLYAMYDNNDLRKTSFFGKNPDGSHFFKGSYDNSFYFFSGIATDEIYLIRAESAARLGFLEIALDDLNTLLKKRWKSGTFTPITARFREDILQIILAERKKQLLFRAVRWMDIKRLNMEDANINIRKLVNSATYELKPNDRRFAWPLPPDIVNMTGMVQNLR